MIAELKEERELLAEIVRSGNAYDSDLARLERVMDEIERIERVHRGEKDVLYFGMEYFSEDANPGNADNLIPAGVNVENSADFHKELCNMLDKVSQKKVKNHIAWSCSRGSAKTSYLSNIFLIHQVVYRKKKFVVLFSETSDMAGSFISWTRYQLKLNEKIRDDFGELLHVKPSLNDVDNRQEFITTSNTKVVAKGLQVQTRGLRHGSSRPDLIIGDDLESAESTNTPEQIEKSKKWFREELMPALSQDGTIVYIGTILCYGSLLDYVIRERKDFDSRRYAAIEQWSERDDLWNEWRDLYREDSEDAYDKSLEFFKENEEEMIEGTKVIWPQRWTYYELMEMRENNGAVSFAQEMQNTPTDEERQIFKPEYFSYFNDGDLEDLELEYYCGIDFAMGRETGDYSAITTIAKNKSTNICYVVDVVMEKIHPDVLLNTSVEKALEYQYEAIGAEAVMAQEWFADKLIDALQSKGYPGHTRVRKIKHRTRKSIRIEALLPEIQSGRLRFHEKFKGGREMMQFELYGMTADDFPDSCAMAYSTAASGNVVIRTTNKRMR